MPICFLGTNITNSFRKKNLFVSEAQCKSYESPTRASLEEVNVCIFLIIFPRFTPFSHAKAACGEKNQMIGGDVKSCYNFGGYTVLRKQNF